MFHDEKRADSLYLSPYCVNQDNIMAESRRNANQNASTSS